MNPDFVIKDSVLKQYKGAGGDVVIPDGVTKLDSDAFRFCDSLITVSIPDSVTSISSGVFCDCSNLTSVTIPGSVKTIGFGAFRRCESLTSVILMDGVEELGGDTFYSCRALKSVVIPGSVKKLWDGMFSDFESCDAVTVVCPEGSYAHKYCKENRLHFIFDYQYTTFGGLAPQRIEKITSPFQADEEKPFIFISYSHKDSERIFVIIKRLYEAGWKIWYDEGLTIGDSYDKEIERHVEECSVFLLFVTENSQHSKYIEKNEVPWGIKYKKPVIKCILDEGTDIPVNGKAPLVTVGLDGVDEALENIDGLIKGEEHVAKGIVVTFNPQNRAIASAIGRPGSTEKKKYAYCLYSEKGTNRARSILFDARESGCQIYDGILDGEDPELLETSPCLIVFLDNAFLEDPHLVKILTDAFDQKRDLAICRIENITLPKELEKLKKIHWLNYSHNEDDIMNAHLASYLAARDCRSEGVLPGFSYENTKKGIIITDYHGTGTRPVIEAEYNGMPVISIDDEAFKDRKHLESIVIPDSVSRIGVSAFQDCAGLKEIVIGKKVKEICSSAFSGCTALSSVKLPKNLKTISDNAFNGCISLTSITIPDKTEHISWSAFENCTGLTSVKIPNSMKLIEGQAFQSCTALVSLDLGKGIKEIEWGGFDDCSALKSLVIPGSIPIIYGFSNCTGLSRVDFEYGVKTIGAFSFAGCWSLDKIVLPKSVVEIESGAFKKCEGLSEVVIPDSVKSIDTNAFEDCPNLTIICSKSSYACQYCQKNGISVNLGAPSNLANEDEKKSKSFGRGQSATNTSGEEKVGFFGRLFKKKKKKDAPSKKSISKQGSKKKPKMSKEEKDKALFYQLTGELFDNGIFTKIIELKMNLGCVVNVSDSMYLLFFYAFAAENDIEEIIGVIVPKDRITRSVNNIDYFYRYISESMDEDRKINLSEKMVMHFIKWKEYTDQNGPDLDNVDPDADEKLIQRLPEQ